MEITPDQFIVWQNSFLKINNTIFFTWIVMGLMIIIALILRSILTYQKNIGKLQAFFEVLVVTVKDQINKMGNIDLNYVFPFIATLFIFIFLSNTLDLIPFFQAPTASLSTTIALVIFVILLGISYGVKRVGFLGYLKKYGHPIIFMLPINIISDISSNISLAVRLYGNIMSGMVIGAIVSKVAFLALGLPIFLNILGFIGGAIQAYIFCILALVFIMSADN